MRIFFKTAIAAVLIAVSCAPIAHAWEVRYDASTGSLPTAASPAWKLFIYDEATPMVSNGALCIQHTTTDGQAYYSRESLAIAAAVPVTMEVRTSVTQMSGNGAAVMSIQTKGAHASVYVYSDHLAADGPAGTFYGDFTTFHTIRLAYDGASRAYVWVDDQLALSWGLTGAGGQNGVTFGSYLGAGSYDSYWQYVAYSKQFLPVPEPSSLLALAGGIAGFGGFVLRRKRR